MKKILLMVIFLGSLSSIFAQDDSNEVWSIGTANTLPEGRYEFGVFQRLQYGYTNNTELFTHPLLFFVMPNIGMKTGWGTFAGFKIATSHNVSIPTLLIDALSKEGIGGLLPEDTDVPFILSFDNHILATFKVNEHAIITPKIGFSYSYVGDSENFPTLDYHLLYSRMADYYDGPTMYYGIAVQGQLSDKFHYLVDGDVFMMSYDKGNIAIEHSLKLGYEVNRHINMYIGYKFSLGKFPYTQNKKLFPNGYDSKFFPMLDFLWGFD